MAKLTAWLVTIIGVLLLLPPLGVASVTALNSWLVPLLVLIIGIAKLSRNYSGKHAR